MIKNKKLCVTILLFLAIVTFSVAFLPIGAIKNTFAQGEKYVTSSNGVLVYDENEFEVQEDYSAFVPAAVASPKGGTTLLDPNGEQLMRLDQGKKGLLVKSKQTGKDVEGDSFSFANPLSGNFEMDFRVFSEKSVESGVVQLQMKGGNIAVFNNDDVLPALDIRRLGITIRSISNPLKAFTIYAYSGQSYAYNHQVSLSVYIHGESWYSWYMGEEYRGYGLEKGEYASDYGYNTSLNGTTMSNANAMNAETFSTTVKFDVEKMCVYGVHKNATKKFVGGIGYVGATYVEEDVLVRNLATNNTKDDNSGALVNGKRLEQLGTLSKEDFIDGYTTSVTIEKMTSNDTVLTKTVKDTFGGDLYGNAITEKVLDPYDRYAKMIIYSVNGQDFVKNDEWTVDNVENNTIINFDTAKGVSQIENAWDPTKGLNATYVTDVKYGTEAGSTKFVADGKAVEFSTKTPYIRYHGDQATFSLPVYVTGTTNDYVLQVWTKTNVYLSEVQIKPNVWSVLTFKSNANWNFDLNDVYFTVHKVDWSTDNGANVYFGKMTISHTNSNYLPEKHIQLTSSATNIAAEGNAYGLNSADFKMSDGTYILGMTAKSENYASKTGTETYDIGDYYTENVYSSSQENPVYIGTGSGTYQKDPYSDVRELGLTIRSTIDPTKAFTIYLSSSTFRRARTTVRVAVEGESYRNGSGQMGFTYVTATNTALYREYLQRGGGNGISGTMGQFGNTGTSYNSMNELFSYVKFDPTTMNVYTYGYSWQIARSLSSNMLGAAPNSACDTLKTLDASDFADGNFTMELFVSEMNTEWNKGLANVYSLKNGVQTPQSIGYDVLSESYDRKCIIDVVSGRLNSGIAIDNETAYAVNQPGYEVKYEYLNMTSIKDAVLEEEITLNAPALTTLFGSKILDGDGAYQSVDGTDFGTFTFTDGVATFSPTKISEYIITFNGIQRKIKVGYGIKYFDGDKEKERIILDNVINLSDYDVITNNDIFLGWTIEGQEGIYSSEHAFETTNGAYFEAQFIDLKIVDPSIRMEDNNVGLRFKATFSKAEYENLISLVGEGNYEMTYSVTGNMKTYEKPITFDNFFYDEVAGEYYVLLSVVNLKETQYATDFNPTLTLTYKTYDGEEITINAIEGKDPEKYIREVANELLNSENEYSEEELKVLNNIAHLRYAKRIFNSIPKNNHVQGIGVDENYIYSNYGPWLIKQDIETGEIVGTVENMRIDDEHGGNVVVHDGKVYIALMLSGSVTLSGNHTLEKFKFPNCFIIEIDADKIVGVVDALNTDIVRCVYIGHPIVELALSSKGYDANGKELSDEYWGIGGRLAIVNAVDSIAWGPAPGHNDGKEYLTLGFSTPGHNIISDGGYYSHQRVDADYFPVMQFDVSKWTDDMYITFGELMEMRYSGKPFTQDLFKGPREFDNIWYYYMGPQDYGIQNLCYDPYQNVYIMGTYGMGQSYALYNQEQKFTSFRGFVLDCDNAEYKEIPLSGGLKGYVVKEKCGQEGKQGILGFNYGEIKWGTGVAAMGDGYYYICVSGNGANGGSTAENLLYRWHINENNKNTASQPFEQIV